jgi:hypothetical protein
MRWASPSTTVGSSVPVISFDFVLRDDHALPNLLVRVESSLTPLDEGWFPLTMEPSASPNRWKVGVPVTTGSNARQFFRFKVETP